MTSDDRDLWEYKVIWLEIDLHWIPNIGFAVEGIETQLNNMGKEGWELVFLQPVGGKLGNDAAYIFKRPKRNIEPQQSKEIVTPEKKEETHKPKSPKIDWNSKW